MELKTATDEKVMREVLIRVRGLALSTAQLYTIPYEYFCRISSTMRETKTTEYKHIVDVISRYHADMEREISGEHWEIALVVHNQFQADFREALEKKAPEEGITEGMNTAIKKIEEVLHNYLRG